MILCQKYPRFSTLNIERGRMICNGIFNTSLFMILINILFKLLKENPGWVSNFIKTICILVVLIVCLLLIISAWDTLKHGTTQSKDCLYKDFIDFTIIWMCSRILIQTMITYYLSFHNYYFDNNVFMKT